MLCVLFDGWLAATPHLTLCTQVVPGELTIVTGLSNSGKSEWLDALTVNLARQHGWTIAMCSLENTPTEHGRKLMEKYTGEQAAGPCINRLTSMRFMSSNSSCSHML